MSNQKTIISNSVKKSARLVSLDTLRGFDMFWITGGAALISQLAKTMDWGFLNGFAAQMHHVKWEGFALYDLIFPLFMFISGVAIPYAILSKLKKASGKSDVYKKITKRLIILVFLGFVYNGLLKFDFTNFRYASVLGQIGFAYFFAALIAINAGTIKKITYWILGILTTYGILQLLVPVPGTGAGVLTPTGCINGYIDRMLLPGKLYGGTYDPEGWLCIVSAVAITLMGVVAGMVLKSSDYSSYNKFYLLCGFGGMMIITGKILSIWYPMIKNCWTSTFNLYAGGFSLLLLAVFYLVIDIWGYRKWTLYFRVIGVNSITIYLGTRVFDFLHTSKFFFGGLIKWSGHWGAVSESVGFLVIVWIFLYILYKKNIFLKV